jgi:hypothetical protein
MPQPGVFAAADAVFDAGMRAVSGIEVGKLAAGGVGGMGGVAVAVAFFEGVELGAGMRAVNAGSSFSSCGPAHQSIIWFYAFYALWVR